MRYIDNRRAEPLLQALDLELHRLAQLLVQRTKWLIHQQNRRLECQRPRQGNALLLAAGQLLGVALAKA
ncbi:hypothetical protein D3C71_2031010 [compost metagenome]